MKGYLLDNRRPEAGERFVALAELFDPWTFRHLDDVGLGQGWRCWEVGAGGVSVPHGLAERVGTSGRVLATDIDVSWIEPAAGGALEVRRHDVIHDPPPAETFDLVHARLVLVHLTDRATALRVMIEALRPGGWLVLEDADPALQPLACPDERGPAEELANRLRTQPEGRAGPSFIDLHHPPIQCRNVSPEERSERYVSVPRRRSNARRTHSTTSANSATSTPQASRDRLAGTAAVAAAMAYQHSWQPPTAQLGGVYYLVYLSFLSLALGLAPVVAATVTALAVRRYRLLLTMSAAGGAALVAFAVVFALSMMDGCLGPLNTMAHSCRWKPTTDWGQLTHAYWVTLAQVIMPSVLRPGIFLAATLVLLVQAVSRVVARSRTASPGTPPAPPRVR